MAWRIVSDGRLVASGASASSASKRDVTVHTMKGVVLGVAPRRESKVEIYVDGAVLFEGKARCERWGSEFVFTGEGFRIEASR